MRSLRADTEMLTVLQDINNSGDGGIYAELIQNRAFQYSDLYNVSTAHYFPVNGAKLGIQFLDEPLSKALPSSMRVTASNATAGNATTGKIGFRNDGYWGIDVRKQKYTGSFWVKGAYKGVFTASLESNLTQLGGSREVYGSVDVESKAVAGEWVEHAFELIPDKDAENSNNTFSITFDPKDTETGYLDFNLISLFPPTYKNRKNGLRIDIAEALADMNPVSTTNHATGNRTFELIQNSTRNSSAFLVVTCLKVKAMPLTGTGRIPSAR